MKITAKIRAVMPRLVAIALLVGSPWVGPPAAAAPVVGKPAPPFRLRDREGALVSLSDFAYPGRARARRPRQVVVLDFFRTDCKPCVKALPRLVALHGKLRGAAVKIFLVALLEQDQGREKLDRFLAKRKLPFPVLVDAYAVAGKRYVTDKGKVRIPALFVIDGRGVLRRRINGLDHKALDGLANELRRLAH
jgi:peroxiredoxin